METDKFGFKVLVKDGPCTRRGILSMVIPYMILWEWQLLSSFHKNLSFKTCRKGLRLEDEILEVHLTRWRAWLYDLLKISQVAIERCVRPVESSDNASCQIHHFCDASQAAYEPLLG